MDISPLEQKLVEQPIELPKNPFWEVLTSFSRDEAIAMMINVAGTAAMDYSLGLMGMQQYRSTVLSLTGPVVEKIGFFPAHIKEAYDVWNTTPESERKALGVYVKQALRNGSKSLALDIAVHDPIYAGLMYTGMQLHAETPAWIIAGASFVAAVFVASGLVVAGNELRYIDLQRKVKHAGFKKEAYYESRFYMTPEVDPESIIARMDKEFNLKTEQHIYYSDKYFTTSLPEISGRRPKVRLRHRVIR